MMMPKKVKYRKQQRGRMTRQGLARLVDLVRRVRSEGHGMRVDHATGRLKPPAWP